MKISDDEKIIFTKFQKYKTRIVDFLKSDQSYWPRADIRSKVTNPSMAWKTPSKPPSTWLLLSN